MRSPRRRFLALPLALWGCARPFAAAASAQHALDDDGVQMLYPSAWGSKFFLGAQDPNATPGLVIEKGVPAIRGHDGAISYWKLAAYDLDYSSGGSGKTCRLHVHASGGQQIHTWRAKSSYLSSPSDLKNQEFTAYLRVRGIFDARRAAVTLKIRGGRHTQSDGDLASCTMMTFAPKSAPAVTRFGKELHHPDYDYVALEPRFSAALEDGLWVGLKLVSYVDPIDSGRVRNELYVDDRPFDAKGRPANRFRLFSEYSDIEGRSTGKYETLVDWGGWQTTLRIDGANQLDLAILSVREIEP